jgi:hypothetical protein
MYSVALCEFQQELSSSEEFSLSKFRWRWYYSDDDIYHTDPNSGKKQTEYDCLVLTVAPGP